MFFETKLGYLLILRWYLFDLQIPGHVPGNFPQAHGTVMSEIKTNQTKTMLPEAESGTIRHSTVIMILVLFPIAMTAPEA